MCRAELVHDEHEQQAAAEDTANLTAAGQGEHEPFGRPPKVPPCRSLPRLPASSSQAWHSSAQHSFKALFTSAPEGDLLSAVLVFSARMPDSFVFLLQQVQRSLSDNDRRNSGERGERGEKALRRSSKSTDNAVSGSLLRCGPCGLGCCCESRPARLLKASG